MPVPIPPDAQWDLGDDNLARNTRKALEAAGITPAHADRMTEHQLSLVCGLGAARLERVGTCLERMRNAPAAEQPGRTEGIPDICGLTLGRDDQPHFVCTLTPHLGNAHANPGAFAVVMSTGWMIQVGSVPGRPPRDFTAEAAAINEKWPIAPVVPTVPVQDATDGADTDAGQAALELAGLLDEWQAYAGPRIPIGEHHMDVVKLRQLLAERGHLIAGNNGLRYMAEQAQERAQAAQEALAKALRAATLRRQ